MRIVITHGADHKFNIPDTLKRDWSDALRAGLEAVGHVRAEELDIDFAFYGDLWRPDRSSGESDEQESFLAQRRAALTAALGPRPSALARMIADQLVSWPGEETLAWDRLQAIVDRFEEGSQICEAAADPNACKMAVLGWEEELRDYFSGRGMREKAHERLRKKLSPDRDETLLVAHSMGSVIAYDLLAEYTGKALGVVGLVTFGSAVGLHWIRKELRRFHDGATPFPDGLLAWTNVYNPEDWACMLEPLLAKRYGPRVNDVKAQGLPTTDEDRGPAHDPIIYLSSVGLGRAVSKLLSGA